MPDLASLTPLGDTTPRRDRIGGVTIAEACDWALASVTARRGRASDAAGRMAAMIGTALPGPGAMVRSGDWRAVWLAPESWLLAAPLAGQDDIEARLRDAVGDAASVTEQTDAWARFDITAANPARVGALLERLCNIPPARLTPGAATRTVFEHLGVIMLRETDDSLSILGARSSARSLHHALTTVARSLA